ncbi:glycosyltransferase [Pluralibacter gergoviae]|uniref:glycosyltransferase n=1 Tax=Pluralibacter gergoviae TaxID=61647 RepID=UPI003EE18DBB
MNKYITVYIPTHNRPTFLERALKSLTMQTYKHFQVGVCDDGSTSENSKKIKEVIDSYKPRFSDLFFIRNDKPLGACAARNKIINRADGEYITGLDDDDEFTKERLQLFVENWTSDYSYLSSGHLTYDGVHYMKSPICLGQETTLEKILYKNVVGNQVFTEKRNFKKLGGFDESMPAWQDYDMWVRIHHSVEPVLK